MATESVLAARKARAMFVALKRTHLRRVAAEMSTREIAVRTLRRRYDLMTSAFLRVPGTTYADWLEHGPKAELDELLAAASDPAVWDRLVETYDARSS